MNGLRTPHRDLDHRSRGQSNVYISLVERGWFLGGISTGQMSIPLGIGKEVMVQVVGIPLAKERRPCRVQEGFWDLTFSHLE